MQAKTVSERDEAWAEVRSLREERDSLRVEVTGYRRGFAVHEEIARLREENADLSDRLRESGRAESNRIDERNEFEEECERLRDDLARARDDANIWEAAAREHKRERDEARECTDADTVSRQELATLLGHTGDEATWGSGKIYQAVKALRESLDAKDATPPCVICGSDDTVRAVTCRECGASLDDSGEVGVVYGVDDCGGCATLTRERDEARAESRRLRGDEEQTKKGVG